MKKDLHETEYRLMVVQDTSDGSTFLTHCSAKTDETIVWEDGQSYPLLKVHISSSSHPFFTGQEKLVDVEGRVDRFKARQKLADEHREAMLARAAAKKTVKKKSPEVISAESAKTAEVSTVAASDQPPAAIKRPKKPVAHKIASKQSPK